LLFKFLPKENVSSNQGPSLSYEESLRLIVHESTREKELGTAYEGVRDFGSDADDENEDNE